MARTNTRSKNSSSGVTRSSSPRSNVVATRQRYILRRAMAISEALGERRTVEVAAGTLEYRAVGEGPPVVFAHGAGVNADLWRRVGPALAGARCRGGPAPAVGGG